MGLFHETSKSEPAECDERMSNLNELLCNESWRINTVNVEDMYKLLKNIKLSATVAQAINFVGITPHGEQNICCLPYHIELIPL